MLRIQRGGGRLTAAAFAVLVLGGGTAVAQPGFASTTVSPIEAPSAQDANTRLVTLITGDVVQVSGKNVAVLRGAGRQHVTFKMSRSHDHVTVIPSDAQPLLAAGRLDARLFDVTSLIQYGYDQRRPDLPLIMTGLGTPPADAGLKLGKSLKTIKSRAAKADKKRLGVLWQGLTGHNRRTTAVSLAGAKVWLDGVRKPTLDVSVPLIGAPTAWQSGWTGKGVTVAVLDTGIDVTHPDLAGKVVSSVNFAAEYPGEDDRDHVGHGTHVASTIAGSGAASGGRYKGVAPDAQLLNGKVCVEFGCLDSWILAGMQWAAEQGADVVNLSLGGTDTPEVDPLEQAVNDLTAQYGTLFVIAAGNDGEFGDRTVGSPASADAALAVAATSKTDELAEFSSRGPRVGDAAVKPEISAPGVDIVAACSSVGFLCTPGEPYATLSGTSMATPHTVGSAALLVQEHPQWTPAQVKATLMGSAKPLDGIAAFGQGAGRVDVARAIGQTITAEAPSVSFGLAAWPHGDDTPITKTVTYHNSGTSDVTLQLAVRGTGLAMFSLSATTVTVPAGGTSSATLTADTRADVPDGLYSGQLVGTASGVSVSVPYGLEKEAEAYTLTFDVIERDGTPSTEHYTDLVSQTGIHYGIGSRTTSLRLPAGRYFLLTNIGTYDGPLTSLVDPKLILDRDKTETLDARRARPVTITSAGGAFDDGELMTNVSFLPTEMIGYGFASAGHVSTGYYTGQVSDEPASDVYTNISATLWRNGPAGDNADAPALHFGAWRFDNGFPTGLTQRIGSGGLATEKVVYQRHMPGATAYAYTFAMPAEDFAWASGVPSQLPLHRTIYYDAAGYYQSGLDEVIEGDGRLTYSSTLMGVLRHHQAGRLPTATWNGAPFGPSFADPPGITSFLTRRGDDLRLDPAMFSDAAGHAGYGMSSSATARLYRDGQLIAEQSATSLRVTVPPETAEYRLEVEVTRDARLGTSVKGTWTFRSGHTDPDGPNYGVVRLPVTAVGFTPELDDDNYAAPAPIAMVPIVVSTQPGVNTAPLTRLDVQVSTDDGARWKNVHVVRTAHGWYAFVPQKAGTFVSLKVRGVAADGHIVDETLLRAYQVR
ncbi:subtilisin family serine protease [Hamadaea flava]|uniref:S8 family serine peptidase n=1 Tax=Hamadaea flava TaxID=1742688 RepID=A0ABV8LTX2_9ACTN|nr:S8 family serine peptidase [Hamadaea flava]MCP2327213.1 subtilisin family serine protease [Hamadaea flava]